MKTATPTLNRTDLTKYETSALHLVQTRIAEHSLAVGAFVMRSGNKKFLTEAANLFLELHDELLADPAIRIGALEYGQFMSEYASQDSHASQAYQLRERFAFDLYRAVIAERNTTR